MVKKEKIICRSFSSVCECRMILLACQVLIFLLIFLFYGMFVGRELPSNEKPMFFFWIGAICGFSIVALEFIRCRKCPFFRAKIAYWPIVWYVSVIRVQYRLVSRLFPA